eukprot:2539497-Prymnesium_polylepis.1
MFGPEPEDDEDEWTEETLAYGEGPERSVHIRHVPGQQYWDLVFMGLHIWPGARLICDYMHSNPAIFSQCRTLCELGSGTGVVGLVHARLYGDESGSVVLTD